MRNKRTNFLLFFVVAIVLLVVVVWAGIAIVSWLTGGANSPSPYTAVYMTSGDIYFGKLSWFPEAHLTDVWYLERSTGQNGQSQLGVAPFASAFWGPTGDVYINWQNVLFYAPVKNGSQLVQAFENPSAAQAMQGQEPMEQQALPSEPTAPSSATSSGN